MIYKHYQFSSIKIPQQQTHTRLKCKKRMKGDIASGSGVDPQRCTTRGGCVGEWSNVDLNRICVRSSLRFNVFNESSIIARGGPFWWWWFFFFFDSFSSVWIMFVSFSLIFLFGWSCFRCCCSILVRGFYDDGEVKLLM